MKTLYVKAIVGRYVFPFCTKIECKKDYTTFTDTAVITIPNVFANKTGVNIDSLINIGDKVEIYAGYVPHDYLGVRFIGLVTSVMFDKQITIMCEDFGYALKNVNVKSNEYKDVTIKQLITSILKGTSINVNYAIPSDTKIGDFTIENTNYVNVVQVLEELKDNLGILSYFELDTLTIGKFIDVTNTEHNILFQNNIIQNDLHYKRSDTVSMVVKGVTINDKNEKLELFAYLKNNVVIVDKSGTTGEQITLTYYNKTEKELTEILKDNFNNYVYTGYSGSFTTFLEPTINPTDTINLKNLKYPDRNGRYKVRGVQFSCDENGGRQVVELDYKVG